MKINIGVFFGGRSVEHEISIISAIQAINVFDNDIYSVIPIYITKEGKWYTGKHLLNIDHYKNINQLIGKSTEIYFNTVFGDFYIYKKIKSIDFYKPKNKIDIAFPILHGTNGEDGTIQGFFELKGMPYVGCDVLASAIGMDKIIMKKVLRESGLPVVDYTWFTDKDWHNNQIEILNNIERIGYPIIVKPSNLGSSVGISKALNADELNTSIELAGNFSNIEIRDHLLNNI